MTSELSQATWDEFLASHPNAHILQTSAWGELKKCFGWNALHITCNGFGAQLLSRRLAPGISLGYVPMGPVGQLSENGLLELVARAQARRLSVLKIEPDGDLTNQAALTVLQELGFKSSAHTIQPRRTLVVDLEPEQDEILARMHQKTRYNIRLAARKGVCVRPWTDVPTFARMVHETAERDAFGAHTHSYYQKAYDLFKAADQCELLMAEADGEALAAIMVFSRGKRAWYFYGASTGMKRNLMPNYLLQWEAMRWAKAKGCTRYDLWGVPDHPQEELEAQFTDRSDGLWGVYRFKRGFGGALVRTPGAWELPLHPIKHRIYALAMRARAR